MAIFACIWQKFVTNLVHNIYAYLSKILKHKLTQKKTNSRAVATEVYQYIDMPHDMPCPIKQSYEKMFF